MRSLESLFASEFKREVSNIGYKDIYKIPLPQECSKWSVSGAEMYAVKGITTPYYESLNKTVVKGLSKGYVAKRRVIDKASRKYLKQEDGSYVYEDLSIPTSSLVVISNVKISLPYAEYKKKVSKEGYGYIDFVQNRDGSLDFMYILPKSTLYKVNQTALALSVKSMKNFAGCSYMTWSNGAIFLHVIPYNPNCPYVGTRILKTGYSLNYNNEINTLLSFWQEQGIIPNISLCQMTDGTNLVVKGTAVGYNDYIPVELLAVSDKEIYGGC